MVKILMDPLMGIIQYAENNEQIDVIQKTAALYESQYDRTKVPKDKENILAYSAYSSHEAAYCSEGSAIYLTVNAALYGSSHALEVSQFAIEAVPLFQRKDFLKWQHDLLWTIYQEIEHYFSFKFLQ